MKPIIFDIKRYAINDGPGIRTTLFFSGCPLRCVWCHNPESWLPQPHLTYKQSRCIGCRSCVQACPQGALRLTSNGIVLGEGCSHSPLPPHPSTLTPHPCTDSCPTTALEMCGREWTMDDLMAEIEKERDVMEDSGGGVTLCGGEPLMQGAAALAVLSELGRRRLHRAVDTTLYADPLLVEEVARHCELMLVDLKLMDTVKHKSYTGVDNGLVLDNIRLLHSLGTPFFIRVPLIEGVNADDANIEATARFLAALGGGVPHSRSHGSQLQGVHLLPYHDVGRDKHRRLWSVYNPGGLHLAEPSETVRQRCVELFASHGITATVGG